MWGRGNNRRSINTTKNMCLMLKLPVGNGSPFFGRDTDLYLSATYVIWKDLEYYLFIQVFTLVVRKWELLGHSRAVLMIKVYPSMLESPGVFLPCNYGAAPGSFSPVEENYSLRQLLHFQIALTTKSLPYGKILLPFILKSFHCFRTPFR